MGDVKIGVGDETLNLALHKAILEALGAEGRDKIVEECVAHLMKAPDAYGSRQPSPLRQIMYAAAERVARAAVEEQLSGDAYFQAQVRSLYADAMAKVFLADTRDKLVDRIALKFHEAFATSER